MTAQPGPTLYSSVPARFIFGRPERVAVINHRSWIILSKAAMSGFSLLVSVSHGVEDIRCDPYE